MKVPATTDIESMDIYYSIDDNKTEKETCVFADGIAHAVLDVSSLSEGRHTITFFMANKKGMITQAETAFFVKVPLKGTSVENISVDGISDHLHIYDLSGKQVHGKPNAGVYIVNKKKVTVR